MSKMKINFIGFFLLIGIFSLNILPKTTSSSSSSVSLIGIPPQDENYFDRETIKCKNGSKKKFTRAQLNDDFCDCPDGTDEPGTSACPEGKFYCRNVGHIPVLQPSSRVNDGICDCCDGSDEYDGTAKCPNTCWEAGKVAREKLQRKIEMYKGGVTLRKKEIEKGKRQLAKDEDELAKLKSEEKILKGLVEQLKVYKEQVEKAEEKDPLHKEKEEKTEKLAKDEDGGKSDADQKENSSSDDGKTDPSDEPSIDKLEKDEIGNIEEFKDDENMEFPEDENEDMELSEDEYENMNDESESTEGLSKEELGHRVASRWTGKKSEHQTEESTIVKDNRAGSRETSERSNNEINDYNSDITSFSGSWLEKIKDAVRNIFQLINYSSPPGDKLEANSVRKEYNDASARLSDLEARISSLTDKLKHDFGTQKEFYSLYDQCFETKKEKYVYNVCPFKEAYQQEDNHRTQLGYWEKFENSYQIMLFSNGELCWNGPTRSLKVKLRCGLKTELMDVDEPSRCEYVALLTTPALCEKDKLEELKQKLEAMSSELQDDHDEL